MLLYCVHDTGINIIYVSSVVPAWCVSVIKIKVYIYQNSKVVTYDINILWFYAHIRTSIHIHLSSQYHHNNKASQRARESWGAGPILGPIHINQAAGGPHPTHILILPIAYLNIPPCVVYKCTTRLGCDTPQDHRVQQKFSRDFLRKIPYNSCLHCADC